MIGREKLDWMKEVGLKEFERPMKYHSRFGHLYSEEHIINTPLDQLKAGYKKTLRTSEERDTSFDFS